MRLEMLQCPQKGRRKASEKQITRGAVSEWARSARPAFSTSCQDEPIKGEKHSVLYVQPAGSKQRPGLPRVAGIPRASARKRFAAHLCKRHRSAERERQPRVCGDTSVRMISLPGKAPFPTQPRTPREPVTQRPRWRHDLDQRLDHRERGSEHSFVPTATQQRPWLVLPDSLPACAGVFQPGMNPR